eukprot:TRINITY_DN23192_c0_g1_i1.p1 TRINITY_DN23192_c0_g1~~TRINITY_DN23192_c0_g1_i1.p1  ORF type:complete len:1040 (-),score=169.04 TRINITY_DN23192_c0_g1_i1:75-3143(-)
MALARPDTLSLYGGGPHRSRARRCVTVNQPACGFFIAGSSIDDMNGIYCRQQQLRRFPGRTAQLVYKNVHSNWLLVLATDRRPPPDPRERRRRFAPPARRARHPLYGGSSSSEDDSDHELRGRLWSFVDPKGRFRFSHKGDTIIPGAGHRWWHLHEGGPAEQLAWHDCQEDDEYETPDEDAVDLHRRIRAPAPTTSRALIEAVPDDEDELPWQVIAMLDASVMHDLQMAFRRYEGHIARTVAGKLLPRPDAASLESSCGPGKWLFRVVASSGATLHSSPSAMARVRKRIGTNAYVRGVERQDQWLRIARSAQEQKDGAGDGGVDLWVRLQTQDGAPILEEVREGDGACLEAPPEDADADVLDRPFEPRIQPADEAGDNLATNDSLSDGGDADAAEELIMDEPPIRSASSSLEVGSKVALEGLSNPLYNAANAVVISLPDHSGRQLVRLTQDGKIISVKPLNVRPILETETGSLGRAARVLNLSLADLGLAEEKLSERDEETSHCCKYVSKLEAALRAAQRDTIDMPDAWNDVQEAYDELSRSLAGKHEPASPDTNSERCGPPHEAVEFGELGAGVASFARLAGCETSMDDVETGIAGLRQVLANEQRRLAKLAGTRWPPRAVDLASTPAEGSDALRLRLTLVRALLRGRREEEALREARRAVGEHPTSAAASLWKGRCLLRLGQRDEGISEITRAADAGPGAGADGMWGHRDATKQLSALRKVERCRNRAENEYGLGNFGNAALHYGEALAAIPVDDKWGRATLLGNRAACYRRDRSLHKAIADCNSALALFPRYARALFRRGACQLEVGLSDDATRSFEMLLRLDRSWPNLIDWLVRAAAQSRRTQRGGGFQGFEGKGRRSKADAAGDASAGDETFCTSDGKAMDHYTILGVTTDATEKQLKRAYRLMSLKYHPDKQGGSTRAFQQIAVAYQTLSDPEKRRAYDDGADIGKERRSGEDSSSDSDREKKTLREEVERKYFPERYKFWPFGDPFIEKRKLQAKRRKEAGKPAFHEEDDWRPGF